LVTAIANLRLFWCWWIMDLYSRLL